MIKVIAVMHADDISAYKKTYGKLGIRTITYIGSCNHVYRLKLKEILLPGFAIFAEQHGIKWGRLIC